MNLTFESRFPHALNSNVKFENSTSIIVLLVVLKIPSFALEGAGIACKCRNRTTSKAMPMDYRILA